MNIIFEIEARKKANQKTLFIIDDVADSFDYKNKYAIIEYLIDISKQTNFYQIILTHNFDFFRTIQSRIGTWDGGFISSKNDEKIILESIIGKSIIKPFIGWKQELATDNKKLIALIPFVRNLIEYKMSDNSAEYLKLTSLLHWKTDTENILISELKTIFESTISGINFPTNSLSDKVVDLIFQKAEDSLTANEEINLENKIILSIAIRLKAEKFIWSKVTDKSEIDSNQTKKLLERYVNEFKSDPNSKNDIKTLEEVNLMTPENIHLNSFMYEPILDMSDQHLIKLYGKLKNLH